MGHVLKRTKPTLQPTPKDEAECFAEYWNWARVVRAWENRLKEAKIDPRALFTGVKVADPTIDYERRAARSWWPSDGVAETHKRLQAWFYHWPGTHGPIDGNADFSKAIHQTLDLLRRWEQNTAKVCALLVTASLFSRLHSRRGSYPELWPRRACVRVLEGWAMDELEWERGDLPWHPLCTQVLPYLSDDTNYSFDSMDALVRYLSEEHIALVNRFQAVEIDFSSGPNTFVNRAVVQEVEAERERHKAFMEEMRATRVREEEATAERRKLHPRFGEWHGLTRDELSTLVWSKPITHIAKEFGVSDVAIGKRCVAQGIPKPRAGFWAKVRAGAAPDPKGVPPARPGLTSARK